MRGVLISVSAVAYTRILVSVRARIVCSLLAIAYHDPLYWRLNFYPAVSVAVALSCVEKLIQEPCEAVTSLTVPSWHWQLCDVVRRWHASAVTSSGSNADAGGGWAQKTSRCLRIRRWSQLWNLCWIYRCCQDWQRKFSPHLIIRELPPVNYVIQKSKRSRPFIARVDILKLYEGENLPKSWLTDADNANSSLLRLINYRMASSESRTP